MRARPDEVRPGVERGIIMPRVRAARPQAISCASEIAEAGSRKTAMRFMRDYASRRAPAMRAESCSRNFQTKT